MSFPISPPPNPLPPSSSSPEAGILKPGISPQLPVNPTPASRIQSSSNLEPMLDNKEVDDARKAWSEPLP